MFKKLLYTAISAACFMIFFTLTGCGGSGEKLVNEQISDADDRMEMSYDLFNGTRKSTVQLESGTAVRVEISTNAGEISLKITDSSGKTAYTGNKMPSSVFLVGITKTDAYTIEITAKSHVGGYSVSW
jgi:hypothetical protein